jgi:dTDP-4-amino-4,6-dideoxygalactose transaminase
VQSLDMSCVELPVTDRVAASLVRLPISAAFTDADCDDVVTACARVFEHMAARA